MADSTPLSGPSVNRPSNPAVGTEYFDTTLNKPIWYSGSSTWVDATGTSVAAPETTPPTVTASPSGGTYSSPQTVTLSGTDNSGGTVLIYYTTDGTTPTTSSPIYSSPITVSATETIKFFGVDPSGNSSAVQSQTYTINTLTVLVSDDFNRANNATTPGSTNSYKGGTNKAWVVDSGTLGIISNQLYAPTTTGSRAHIDAGVSDAKMEVTVAVVGNEHDFYFRVNPTNPVQYLRYAYNTAGWFLQEQNSTFTTITSFPGTLAAGDVIAIDAVGSTVKLSKNGTVIHTANSLTDLQTNTGFGLGFSGSTAGRYDNFSITSSSPNNGGGGDTTAPVLTITPGGTFLGTKTVTMSTNETATIYYTLDGTTPTTSSSVYTSPLSITATTTLKAFAKDTAGNISAVQTVTYTLSSVDVSPRPTNYVLVTDYGATGNGTSDDTSNIQSAVNAASSQGKAVIVPVGNYRINPNVGINLPSNTTIYFDNGAVFTSLATSAGLYKIINALNVSNINIIGYPKIVGDRDIHIGTSGESGMGLYIRSCTNVYIENANISKCWGDAIYLGNGGGAQTYNQNVIIKNCVLDNNRRQGISVISVKGLQIINPTITNTHGTDPQSGIDFEPNNTTEWLQNITVTNPNIQFNANHGIHFWLGFGPGSNPISIDITNASNVKNNTNGNIYFGGANSSTRGYVKIDGTYYLNR
jgi:hypothetical protein